MNCPHCGQEIDYAVIMGDSDWDDQGIDNPYQTECPKCENEIEITQIDIEVNRYFVVEKANIVENVNLEAEK